MSLSSLNSIEQIVFELVSGNENVNRQTDGQTNGTKNGKMNGRNYTNFRRNLAMMVIYIPVKYEFDWTNRFGVRVRKRKMWTDIWMDRQIDKKRTNRWTNKQT